MEKNRKRSAFDCTEVCLQEQISWWAPRVRVWLLQPRWCGLFDCQFCTIFLSQRKLLRGQVEAILHPCAFPSCQKLEAKIYFCKNHQYWTSPLYTGHDLSLHLKRGFFASKDLRVGIYCSFTLSYHCNRICRKQFSYCHNTILSVESLFWQVILRSKDEHPSFGTRRIRPDLVVAQNAWKVLLSPIKLFFKIIMGIKNANSLI